MRLKQIKLAGFKSFVDPTVVPFPEQLTAVVGPNGCGKSNIIDAVRWVLGESSAKNLRGDAMTDVIFNGSTARPPASQASVELIFDNSEGRATGAVATFNEIAVRRVVTHEAQNTYYLNGSKCRRKDIADVFLGTGLGPRSYAIIEQGMISRLIECRPQELRVFIEEAAGISKYKERRRETENRIKHTRENLERLNDVREELGKQLEKLQRQARAATRYRELKAQERQKKGELSAIRYRQLQERLSGYDQQLRQLEVAQAQRQSALTANERALSETGVELHGRQDEQERLKQHFYQLGNQIARLEQQVEHSRQRRQQLEEEERRIRLSLHESQQLLADDQEQLEAFQMGLEELSDEQAIQDDAVAQAEADVQTQEQAQDAWQQRWQGLQQAVSQQRQRLEVLRSQSGSSSSNLERFIARQGQLQHRLAELTSEDSDQALPQLDEAISTLILAQEAMAAELQSLDAQKLDLDRQVEQQREAHTRLRDQLQLGRARMASLETLQQAAVAEPGDQAWLAQADLLEQPPLFERLRIEPGFEPAFQQVLGQWMRAREVAQMPDASRLAGAEQEVRLIRAANPGADVEPLPLPRLADKLLEPVALPGWLVQTYLCDDLPGALAWQARLAPGQSVVTPEGIWLGPNWLVAGTAGGVEQDLLARTAEIKQLDAQLAQQEQQLEAHERQLSALEQQQAPLQTRISSLAEQRQQLSRQQLEHESERRIVDERLAQQRRLRQGLEEELAETAEQIALEAESREALAMEMAELEERLLEEDDSLQAQESERERLQHTLRDARQQLELQRHKLQQLRLTGEGSKSRLAALTESIRRLGQQRLQQQARLDEVLAGLQADDTPQDELAMQLEELLEQRLGLESELAARSDAVETLRIRQQELQAEQIELRSLLQQDHNQLGQLKLDREGYRVRRDGLLEQLEEIGQDLQVLLEALPGEVSEQGWQAELERLGAVIKRLGAINLAAIDEYEAQSERKRYLDEQNADLEAALETLEAAIRKIDRETRQRFKQTYEQVNDGLKRLFPKVFGGGSATLALTDDDLLETGVTIMARPPGKKNSTIHLLSGGEKALTALSLVFAIFQLNPAPFCLLDEVDAPLDDANVGRFCNLVKEMSSTVQFIYISHNKVTMEMAAQLTGVTMREPGVSRMVAVDIEEAVAMAE